MNSEPDPSAEPLVPAQKDHLDRPRRVAPALTRRQRRLLERRSRGRAVLAPASAPATSECPRCGARFGGLSSRYAITARKGHELTHRALA